MFSNRLNPARANLNLVTVPDIGKLDIGLLGPVRISRSGAALSIPTSRKTRAIMGYLILSERPVSRQRLCELFFDIPDDPRAALRWSLAKLRPLLDDPGHIRLRSERDTLAVNLSDAWVDALTLADLASGDMAGRSDAELEAVLGGSSGALMEDCDLPKRPEYTAWLTRHRHELLEAEARLLRELVRRRGDNPAARIAPLQRLIAANPLDELAYAELVAALTTLGRRGDAEALAGQAERALAREGLKPGPALRAGLQQRSGGLTPPVAGAVTVPQINSRPSPAPRSEGAPVVAVLPFADISMEPLPGHILDGFFEGLVHALSRFRSLVIIAGASTTAMRGKLEDPVLTAQQLGADILVGGSLMRASDGRLRLRWRAIDSIAGQILAFGDIEGRLDDVWDLQESAAINVAVEVEPRAQAEAYRARIDRPTTSAVAYDLYLQGLFTGFSLDGRDYAKALDHFEEAIRLDPAFHPALAMAPWAAAYANKIAGPKDIMRLAEMSRAALRFGINDARTQATAGTALFYMAHDYASATSAIERAIEINPNEYTAWICGGWMHAMKGEADLAHAMFDRSEKLNPLAYGANGLMSGRAMAEFMADRLEDAERHIRLALSTDDGHPSALMTGVATAAALGSSSDLEQRRSAFLAIYPDGLANFAIQALPFEDPSCRARYFDAVRAGGVPG